MAAFATVVEKDDNKLATGERHMKSDTRVVKGRSGLGTPRPREEPPEGFQELVDEDTERQKLCAGADLQSVS